MTRSMSDLTAPEVAGAIARSPLAVIPLGSVEQHGPHLPCGTDTYAAALVAKEVAEGLDGLIVDVGPYGVTPIHAGHPGTIDLRRSTFEALLWDVAAQLVSMGVSRLVLVNWHEGNIASMDAVATDLQSTHEGVVVVAANACYVAQSVYSGEGGELTHGGGLESLAVLAHDPDLAKLDRAGVATRQAGADELDAMRRGRDVYGYITDVTEIDPAGWYGDPDWGADADPAVFARRVAAPIVERARQIFDLRSRS